MKMLIATLMMGGIVTAAPEMPVKPMPVPGHAPKCECCEVPQRPEMKRDGKHRHDAKPGHRHGEKPQMRHEKPRKPEMQCPRCGKQPRPVAKARPQRDFEWRVDRQRRVHPVIERRG